MVILAAVKSQSGIENVVSVGLELAEAFNEELKLTHIVEQEEGRDDAIKSANSFLDDLCLGEQTESARISTEVRVGDPVKEIEKVVDADTRLLLIGSRHRSAVGKVVVGSVARSILFNIECQKVTIPLDTDRFHLGNNGPSKPVLACVDRSQRSREVVREGAILADALGVDLHVAHVLSKGEFVDLERESYENTGQTIELDDMKRVAATFASEAIEDVGVEAQPVGLVGDPAHELKSYADESGASYFVVTSRRRSSVGKAIFGSVAQSLILSAELPVFLVKDE
ncbi:Nucleotide-binding universal stress protein, UspA family [Halopenitus malekzadehii]|uniref:Nucleotide-binding universal stress protein, UspA family n=1 Tax=Halopenitus malekzadehii TaxID=1267564 RepID=A0A1H6JY90_9EURY|nr:universal stress protein [Halopenitus malekzadehii]SEH64082.1 Nucleotide-binding universal stress protein, UspA family [Halopenitus malekzadehii]